MGEPLVRSAEERDVERIAALTTEHRNDLARWAPQWWAKADGADALHELWLRHLVSGSTTDVRVAEVDGVVVGVACLVAQRGQWFVDDLAVDEEHWSDAGQALLRSIRQRPALTTCATRDAPRAQALVVAGLTRVSSCWVRHTSDAGDPPAVERIGAEVIVHPPPPHTFGGAFDPLADGALAFALDDGIVVGSPSVTAPPVYDPGGTITLVDRVAGPDRAVLVDAAVALAAARGDVLLCVVVGVDDDLAQVLAARGFGRAVEVHAWT